MAIYRLLQKDVSFDQEMIEAMYSAYEQACIELDLKTKNDRVTELVAVKIIEAAKSGVRSPATMHQGALLALGIIPHDLPQ